MKQLIMDIFVQMDTPCQEQLVFGLFQQPQIMDVIQEKHLQGLSALLEQHKIYVLSGHTLVLDFVDILYQHLAFVHLDIPNLVHFVKRLLVVQQHVE